VKIGPIDSLCSKTEVLFDRLTERGYSEKERGENLEVEIMQVVLDEARESYEEDIVQELPSNTVEEMNSNIDRCRVWMAHWIENNNNS
jgi:adenylate kinase